MDKKNTDQEFKLNGYRPIHMNVWCYLKIKKKWIVMEM